MLIEPIQKELLSKGPFYGIDLGTTYTVIARIDAEQIVPNATFLPVKMMTIEQHSPLPLDGADASDMVASVLAVDEQNRMYVGNKLYRLKGHPSFVKDKNLFYHWKLDLGVSLKPLYPQAVRPDVDDAAKVAGKILNYCRMQLHPQTLWKNVIVTVPASFQANQRSDVLAAAAYAKIEAVDNMLVDEPNAAFVGYINQLSAEEKQTVFGGSEACVLVIDFGGGTCDLSILKINPVVRGIKIANLAISRYNNLGGQDIDLLVAERWLLPQFSRVKPECEARVLEQQVIPQLAVMAEKLKIDLSRTISATLQEPGKICSGNLRALKSVLRDQRVVVDHEEVVLDEVALEGSDLHEAMRFLFLAEECKLELTDKVIQSVPSTIFDILQKANLAKTDVDFVLFAGGSVQNLIFVDEVSHILPDARILLPRRPDTLVAQGAAIISFYRNALNFDPIQPISAETIGVATSNSGFFPLIKAGTALPFEVELPTFALQDFFQRRVVVPLCMGHSDSVVQTLEIDLPQDVDYQATISIRAMLTAEKVFRAQLKVGDRILGQMEVNNPFVLANITPQERVLAQKLQDLAQVVATRDRNKEREILRSLIWEYYNLQNYGKAAQVGEDWIKKFDCNDVLVYNIVYCAYDNLGQRRKALEYLDKALLLRPEHRILCYNKSLVIGREDGHQAALDYLEAQEEWVQQSTSISLRMALLGLKLGKTAYASVVEEKYHKGAYDNCSPFDRNLLILVLKGLGIQYEEPANGLQAENSLGFGDYKGDLLKVKGNLEPSDEK